MNLPSRQEGGGARHRSRYLVGIDLGTTHTALASIDLAAEGDPVDSLQVMPIPQLVAPSEVGERTLLPSNVYLPGEHELPAGSCRLPWGETTTPVGEFARVQGSRVPGRLVASAKSWFSHPRVDRGAEILPWGAPEGVQRISPVTASARYLAHLVSAWNERHPGEPLGQQDLVLTVPASFDAVARELTLRAAHEAGMERVRLIEEPQAAFYDFTSRHRSALAEALGERRLVLVCDVGGGTTDLTLIHVASSAATPVLSRIAVGDHLLLGGDNVDITLARRIEERLTTRLDAVQWSLLVQACRTAKERLLADGGPVSATVTIPGRGARLVGGALSGELTRDEVLTVLLDGFFPRIGPDESPHRRGRTGLVDLGLPYESDPAITRHVLSFLRDHADDAAVATGRRVSLPRPDAILLNGGVFIPAPVRERLQDVVSSWYPDGPRVDLLDADRLDVAVARGAAYSALVRRGLGLRIGGGTPRAYFVGVEAQGEPTVMCLIPRHQEEGTEVEVPHTFALRLDRPVRFTLHATTRARFERAGDLVALADGSFQELPPIETVLRAPSGGAAEIPVRLRAMLTEIGTLEVFCVAQDRDARWKLEFGLRGAPADEESSEVAAMPRRFEEARAQIDLFFGKKATAVEKRDVKGLGRSLEKVLGSRESWNLAILREIWSSLHAGMARRRRSAEHERQWLALTGYALRPGFGAPLDTWRSGQTFAAFAEGLQFQADPRNWSAWWILWRRIAGGLDEPAQNRILEAILPFLPPPDPRKPKPRVAGVKPEALDELIRLAGALERVSAARKRQAGEAILERIGREGPAAHLLWALGRIGARLPFHGSSHTCVGPEVAEHWLERLAALPVRTPELAFPVAQLARMSGDRARDVAPEARDLALNLLEQTGASATQRRQVRELVALGAADEQRIFGEGLPAGLRLLTGMGTGHSPESRESS